MQRSADLVYGLPINAPILVLFVDIYAAGTDINLDGNTHNLIAAYGLNGFAISESTLDQTAKTLASARIKIWPRFGFSHTIVFGKASSFINVFF